MRSKRLGSWPAGAVVGNRLYLASGDIQSAGITGMRVVTDSHDIFEFGDR